MIATMAKKKTPRRTGPPKRPPEIVRSESIRFMLTPAERADIESAAEIEGKGLSDYIRDALLPHSRRTIEEAGE